MIRTLPERSRSAFAGFRSSLMDLLASLRARRPLTPKMVVEEVQYLLDLSADLELDVLSDLSELQELADAWELDDRVNVGNGKAVAS